MDQNLAARMTEEFRREARRLMDAGLTGGDNTLAHIVDRDFFQHYFTVTAEESALSDFMTVSCKCGWWNRFTNEYSMRNLTLSHLDWCKEKRWKKSQMEVKHEAQGGFAGSFVLNIPPEKQAEMVRELEKMVAGGSWAGQLKPGPIVVEKHTTKKQKPLIHIRKCAGCMTKLEEFADEQKLFDRYLLISWPSGEEELFCDSCGKKVSEIKQHLNWKAGLK